MRWLFSLMAMAAGVALLCSVQAQQPKKPPEKKPPDLEIKRVEIVGTTAKVLVNNKGAGDAGPCRLRMDILQKDKGDKFKVVDQLTVNVPALEKKTNAWVFIPSSVALQGAGRKLKFEVNVTKAVKESDYSNNIKYHP